MKEDLRLSDTGLSYRALKQIIRKHLDKNADLIIGLDDPELSQLVDVICEGVAIAIEANNKELASQINRSSRDLGLKLL